MLSSGIPVTPGARPEAVKLCPLIARMRAAGRFPVRECVTAQHREMLARILSVFNLRPDHDPGFMRPGQILFQSTVSILSELERVIAPERPGLAVFQGEHQTG